MRLQRRELKTVEDQLDLNRQQIEVTREQVRPHLELQAPSWPQPEQLPMVTVTYVSGSEAASDVCIWLRTNDGRRFGKAANAPSPGRPSNNETIGELPDDLAKAWDVYFAKTDEDLALTDGEWWAAVTWQAADKTRYCWMYVQRVHFVKTSEDKLPIEQEE